MSRRNVTKFCSVCHAAGKPESEYTNHFVKSEPGVNGVVVCPTLLSQNCRYCKKAGHTVSHCELLKSKQKEEKNFERIQKQRVFEDKKKRDEVPNKTAPSFGRFADLDTKDADDSDQDDDLQRRKNDNVSEPKPVVAKTSSIWGQGSAKKLFKASWADDEAWMSDSDHE